MNGKAVGVDLGLESFVATSDGFKVKPPKLLRKAERNLKRKQQNLSRKKKGSNNRHRARIRVARCHDRVARQRSDWLHKLSRRLVDENQVICVEDLHVKGMIKNRCLAKAISDVGWGEFARQLAYKARWDGKAYLEADRWYPSSKTFSCCGGRMTSLPLHVRRVTCPSCAKEHDRDVNAAINIKLECLRAAGHPAPACGG
jgi:putative transposase